MDVLRPPIVHINGISYRKNTGGGSDRFIQDEEEEDFRNYDDADPYGDEVCDAFTQIEQTENGWRTALNIPSAYFKFIIGKKGETRRRLENETKTQIRIPKQGEEGDIVIVGREKKGVISAKSRVDILVESARQKQAFTHFLSFPINTDEIKDSFLDFKQEVLKSCHGDRGLDETIFQNPHKLHMTIGTLPLMNDAEISQAKQLLQQCQYDLIEPILKDSALSASVKGLEYMNDDPNAVDVLYAKVRLDDGSDRLQMLADRLVDRFCGAGLMHKDYDRVKLHITVMNTLMRKDPSGTTVPKQAGRGGRTVLKDRESFDADNVLKKFSDYNFGSITINRLDLSQRYSTGDDGYYASAHTIRL